MINLGNAMINFNQFYKTINLMQREAIEVEPSSVHSSQWR